MSYFTECNRTENFLRNHGVKYSYIECLSASELKEGWNEFNAGRPPKQQKVKEAVESYATMMLDGSSAPAVIVHKTASGYEVLDGCQRLMAALEVCEATEFAAYVVNCQPRTAQLIRYSANILLQGSAPVDTTSSRQAIVKEFCLKLGMAPGDVAPWVGVSVEQVKIIRKQLLAVYRFDTAADRLGFRFDVKVPKGIKYALHEATQASDWEGDAAKPLLQMANDLVRGKYNNGDSRSIIAKFTDIRRVKGKDPAVQLESKRSELFRDDLEFRSRVNGRRKASPVEKVQKTVKQLLTQCREAVECSAHFELEDAISTSESMQEACRLLRQISTNEARRQGVFDF